MSTERNDGGPAFPHAGHDNDGMSQRDYFAARAPTEIPHWFAHDETPLPWILPVHTALELQPGFAELSPEGKATLSEWVRDGSWDLDDLLAPIGEAANKAISESRKNREQAEEEREAARYFAWRWHYADAMLRWRGK